MPRGTQISVCLRNEPGALAKVTAALRAKKVNVEAISVVDNADAGIVRIVPSSPGAAKKALAKFGVSTQPVLLLRLADKVGQLERVAARLARAKVNINYVYGSAAGAGRPSTVVLGVSDLAKAAKLVR
jgi:hypothetical protein